MQQDGISIHVVAPWLPKRLGIKNVQETQRRFLSTLWNVYSFYVSICRNRPV